jgi:hypothetical protein
MQGTASIDNADRRPARRQQQDCRSPQGQYAERAATGVMKMDRSTNEKALSRSPARFPFRGDSDTARR